jgi:hypothetical protein
MNKDQLPQEIIDIIDKQVEKFKKNLKLLS